MLSLTRKINEIVVIDHGLELKVTEVKSRHAKVSITCQESREIKIDDNEIDLDENEVIEFEIGKGQSFSIDDHIVIKLFHVIESRQSVKLGFDAPADIAINRMEIEERWLAGEFKDKQ